MSMGRDGSREEFWRQAIERCADSGMTIAAFCAREGLKPTTYHYWRRKTKRGDECPSSTADPGAAGALSPVRVIDDRGCAAGVEIVAKNGYVVRVGEQAASEHVRRVLQAVSQLD